MLHLRNAIGFLNVKETLLTMFSAVEPRQLARPFLGILFLFSSVILDRALAASPEIWFGADDPFMRAVKGRPPNDYLDLFTGDGLWGRDVKVIKIAMQFANHGSDEDLSAVIRFASHHGVKLAMEGLMLVSAGPCGSRVEGYDGPKSVEKAAQRIHSLGGRLSYIAMDEPLYYGHVYSGPRGCHTPISDVATQVATRVQHLKQLFPGVQVGDIEPIGSPPTFSWTEPLREWFAAYRAATGVPLAFLHGDINWQRENWPQDLQVALRLSHEFSARFGIIYDGNPADPNGLTWTNNAVAHATYIERNLGLTPDDAVIQSWMPYPGQMLPPSTPGTLTNLVRRYDQLHP